MQPREGTLTCDVHTEGDGKGGRVSPKVDDGNDRLRDHDSKNMLENLRTSYVNGPQSHASERARGQ